MDKKVSSESVVKNNRRRTRKKYSSEEKIRKETWIKIRNRNNHKSRCRVEIIKKLAISP